ncbi:MAG: hypothetical protein KDB14_02295 [Planctomycetales bacterium]|nr:hypothetical protein [Planctomycetales bacterium]
MRQHPHRQDRHGVINVLVAFMLIGLLGMAAVAIDIGYLMSAREELQRSCDSAALAACWELASQTANGQSVSDAMASARQTASTYAGLNDVTNDAPQLATANSADGDVVFGYVSDSSNPNSFTTNASEYNAVRVRVRRTDDINGEVPFFLGPIFGKSGQDTSASATAMLISSVKGFKEPSGGGNLDILPFALDIDTWNSYEAGVGSDDYCYNESTKTVTCGCDGKLEFNLYPQGTGSPGNRGTVDIGSSNNSTNDIARQITDGISPNDLDDLGKPLELDANGELELNGDTGISAGVKDELASIIGQRRVIPIFNLVQGPGNNAQFTIVKWVGIRVMDVKLTGKLSGKKLMVQEAPIEMKGVVPGTSQSYSSSVYSPAFMLK